MCFQHVELGIPIKIGIEINLFGPELSCRIAKFFVFFVACSNVADAHGGHTATQMQL